MTAIEDKLQEVTAYLCQEGYVLVLVCRFRLCAVMVRTSDSLSCGNVSGLDVHILASVTKQHELILAVGW